MWGYSTSTIYYIYMVYNIINNSRYICIYTIFELYYIINSMYFHSVVFSNIFIAKKAHTHIYLLQ